MRSRALRAGVAWVLGAMMAAPAWATCVSALAVLGSPTVCPMRSVYRCPHQDGPRAGGSCCLVDTRIPASNVPVAVTASPAVKLVPAPGFEVPTVDATAVSDPAAFIDARAPLKTLKLPTYLHNSVLQI